MLETHPEPYYAIRVAYFRSRPEQLRDGSGQSFGDNAISPVEAALERNLATYVLFGVSGDWSQLTLFAIKMAL